jgi:hypothetical protein
VVEGGAGVVGPRSGWLEEDGRVAFEEEDGDGKGGETVESGEGSGSVVSEEVLAEFGGGAFSLDDAAGSGTGERVIPGRKRANEFVDADDPTFGRA